MMIWYHALPGHRNVRIDLGVLSTPSPRFPATLFINRESRHETLKHYSIIHATDLFDFNTQAGGRAPPPFIFSPARDTAYLRNTDRLARYPVNGVRHDKWFAHIGAHLPGGLESIKRFLIMEMSFHDMPDPPESKILKAHLVVTLLLQLSGLEELRVEGLYSGDKDEIQARLEEVLVIHQSKFVGGRVPRLKCLST
jgi:hypothetical protein